ncbi:MAG: hypothetical protein LBD23_07830 [Oscillospiraceae bacterium]|jgi:hypothetical protein|nr:hypothetical protein [Oscillospiraceae bacterium]
MKVYQIKKSLIFSLVIVIILSFLTACINDENSEVSSNVPVETPITEQAPDATDENDNDNDSEKHKRLTLRTVPMSPEGA